MNILPDNMLVLAACIAVLAVCALIFAIVFKAFFLIKTLKVKLASMGLKGIAAYAYSCLFKKKKAD